MPEEIETTEQQQDAGTEETVEETATEGNGTEQRDDAQEAETGGKAEEPFDRKKFEAELRKKNSEAANLRKRLKELEPAAAELQRIKDAEKSESERLNDQLARAQEQVTKTRQRLVRTQVQALAMTGFADPEDAVGALNLDSYIDSDGDIDEAAIKADLDALLERKPHWAKSQPQEGPRRPAPDRTQASGANKQRTLNPAEEFAGFVNTRLSSR
jgi:predicted nuclease with TOPRIM domain